MGSIVPFDELDHSEHAHEFVGAEHGHVVVSPPGEAHGFTNTGTGELRLTSIHGASRFDTEWLSGPDLAWTSRPKTD